MRFSLNFNLAHNDLPIEMNRSVVSYVKHVLSVAHGGAFYDSFFHGTISKPYTFAVLLNKPTFKQDRITVMRPMCKVSFSISDNKSGNILFNALLAQKGKTYPLAHQNTMTLKSIQFDSEVDIQDESILVRTVTGGGICVREHIQETNKDNYYAAGNDDFSFQLTRCIQDQVERMGFSSDVAEKVKVECIKGKMVIVKHFGMQIPITIGYFTLIGPTPVLAKLVAEGIGSRHSQGFGMVDCITL